jgi:hypothetical protein
VKFPAIDGGYDGGDFDEELKETFFVIPLKSSVILSFEDKIC